MTDADSTIWNATVSTQMTAPNQFMVKTVSGIKGRREEIADTIATKVVNLEEKAIGQALIKLGWTPPDYWLAKHGDG
jgi:hypothetical protein